MTIKFRSCCEKANSGIQLYFFGWGIFIVVQYERWNPNFHLTFFQDKSWIPSLTLIGLLIWINSNGMRYSSVV